MTENNQSEAAKGKIRRALDFLTAIARPVREWALAITSCIGVITVVLGAHKFSVERKNEAMARYQTVMRDLGDPSDTVRAAAVISMGDLMAKDYDKYGEASMRVLASRLATADDELLRKTILKTILKVFRHAKVKVNATEVIGPLVWENRALTDTIVLSHLQEARSEYELSDNVKSKVSFQVKKTDGNQTEGVLTIERDGQVLAADTLDIAKEKDRSDLITNLASRDPNFCEETAQQLREKMLQIASEQIKQVRSVAKSEGDFVEFGIYREKLLEPIEAGKFYNARLKTINDALAAILRESSTREFEKLDLSKVFLVSSSAEYINLKNTQLPQTDLNSAILHQVDLTGAVLQGANLEYALIADTILENTDLSDAKLRLADLKSDNLRNAKLTSANLSLASLQSADMAGAILDKADIQEADLTDAILEHASLRKANLTHANLENASLQGADLSEADLTQANLAGANLEGANFQRAILKDVDITKAINWQKAVFDDGVIQKTDESAGLKQLNLSSRRLICQR